MVYIPGSGTAPLDAGEFAVTSAPTSDGTVASDAAAWIRSQWANFVGLDSVIGDLQHRAAVAAGNARVAGQEQLYQMGREIIIDLGSLRQLHGKITEKVESLAGYLGLQLGGLGAIFVPVALATTFSTVAIVMLWLMRRIDLQQQLVEGLEKGTLTAADLAALADNPPGTDVLQTGLSVGKLALFAFVAWIALQIVREVPRMRSNPDLIVFNGNPDSGAQLIGESTYALSYKHADNSAPYVHDFRPGVQIWGEPDGSVSLRHPDGRRLWRDF